MSNPMVTMLSRPSDDVTTRLFCFHWSGGNAYSFKNWATSISTMGNVGSSTEVYGITWRSKTKTFDNIKDVVKELRQALFDLRLLENNINTIFLGHSLGGIVAFELVRQLESECYSIDHLIVSGVKHPLYLTRLNLDNTITKRYRDSDDQLFKHIDEIGGLPPGVHPDFLRHSLKGIRDDYQIFETYIFDINSTVLGNVITNNKIKCPITSMSGAIDLSVPVSAMTPWTDYTMLYDTHYEFGDAFKGNHFFINDPKLKAQVLQKVMSICKEPCKYVENLQAFSCICTEKEESAAARGRIDSIYPPIAAMASKE